MRDYVKSLKEAEKEARAKVSQLMLKAADIYLLMEHELRLHQTVNLKTYDLYRQVQKSVETELRRLLK